MAYRNRSNSIRQITTKFAGKCSCCGGDIPAGKFVDYNPAKKQIAHYRAWDGNSAECYGVLRAKQEPFIDIDRAYEDQCADICGR